MALPMLYMARHGETAWSLSGQHTGLSDIPLTPRGERNAAALAGRLKDIPVARVFTSPLQRARRTCELAGFGGGAVVDKDLVEWNYGAYEGKTSQEIHKLSPGWELFRDGCPGGENITDVAGRADRVIAKVRQVDGNTLVFSSGHFLRVLMVRWLGMDGVAGRNFMLDTAALSAAGYEHSLTEPVVRLWNDCRHVVS